MLDTIIAVAIVALLIVGFWWTRGAGGIPGATDDPARQALRRVNELGDPVHPPGEEHEDREQEIE
jgi:FtsZ-interacting cell division protein ZipA